MSKLPDFIIVGAQKCGTTSLLINLSKHPDIFTAGETGSKEIHFFNRDRSWNKGVKYYSRFFEGHEDKICGEKTPDYMVDSNTVAKRMAEVVPHIKIIICVRDPVTRLLSQVNMRMQSPRPQNLSFNHIMNSSEYFGRGLYFLHICNFIKYFPKDQILVVVQDDKQVDRVNVFKEEGVSGYIAKGNEYVNNKMKEVYRFLEVPYHKTDYGFHFINAYKETPYNKDQIEEIRKRYQEDNDKLFYYLNYRIESWG
jgi:hypothetical protein